MGRHPVLPPCGLQGWDSGLLLTEPSHKPTIFFDEDDSCHSLHTVSTIQTVTVLMAQCSIPGGGGLEREQLCSLLWRLDFTGHARLVRKGPIQGCDCLEDH